MSFCRFRGWGLWSRCLRRTLPRLSGRGFSCTRRLANFSNGFLGGCKVPASCIDGSSWVFITSRALRRKPGSLSAYTVEVSVSVEMERGLSWGGYLTESEFCEFSDVWIRVERRGKEFQQRHYSVSTLMKHRRSCLRMLRAGNRWCGMREG